MEGSEGLAYDDLWSDSNATAMGVDSHRGLHYPCMARPPTLHLTPRGMQSRVCWGCQWTICCHWRCQSSTEMLWMWMRPGRITSEPEARRWASHWCRRTYIARFVIKLIVVVKINKAVVGSSRGDTPKYKGEGVVLRGTPSTLGVLLPQCSCLSTAVLGNFGVGMLQAWCIILFADVTSLKGTVTLYVMSQCHTCIGQVTFYYKRAADTSVGSSVCQVRVYHQRPACGWHLTCVGHCHQVMAMQLEECLCSCRGGAIVIGEFYIFILRNQLTLVSNSKTTDLLTLTASLRHSSQR